jgi:hypothetical protein
MQTRITSALAAAAWLSVAAAAQTPSQPHQQPRPQSPSQAPAQGSQNVTVTGCVAAGPNNTFTLSGEAPTNEPPLGTTATTPAGDKVTKTVTYMLVGDKAAELKPHVGHTVQVTGTESAPQAAAQVDEKSPGTSPTGTSGAATPGSPKPKVETTAQAQIVTHQLTVNAVKMVSNSCRMLK